jgi:hypothetical protein
MYSDQHKRNDVNIVILHILIFPTLWSHCSIMEYISSCSVVLLDGEFCRPINYRVARGCYSSVCTARPYRPECYFKMQKAGNDTTYMLLILGLIVLYGVHIVLLGCFIYFYWCCIVSDKNQYLFVYLFLFFFFLTLP